MKRAITSLGILACLLSGAGPASAQFVSYQGRLTDRGLPANGNFDMVFRLFSTPTGGAFLGSEVVRPAVPVQEGLFNVFLDFDLAAFAPEDRFLEIHVRPEGGSTFTLLAPRQQLGLSPYAITALTAVNAPPPGAGSVNTDALQDDAVTAAKLASGAAVKSLNNLSGAVTLSAGANVTLNTSGNTIEIEAGGGGGGGWELNGNSISGTEFIGTLNAKPLDFKVNGVRGLRLDPRLVPNFIAGKDSNEVGSGNLGSAIGGGENHLIKSGASHSVVDGGNGNTIGLDAGESVIGGGGANAIGDDAPQSVISGGQQNIVEAAARFATIPGGSRAKAYNQGQWAYATGGFTAPGEAQTSLYILRGVATFSTAELFLDGSGERLKIPAGYTWLVEIHVIGRAGGTGESGAFKLEGAIKNVDGTVSWVGMGAPMAGAAFPAQVLVSEHASWSVNVEADDVNDALTIKVLGSEGVSRWVARVRVLEVKL